MRNAGVDRKIIALPFVRHSDSALPGLTGKVRHLRNPAVVEVSKPKTRRIVKRTGALTCHRWPRRSRIHENFFGFFEKLPAFRILDPD
jgi:hypothetical protein